MSNKTTNLIEAEWLAGRIIWAELSNGEAKQALKGIIQAYINGEIAARKEAYLRNIRIASVEEIGIGDSIFCYQIPAPHYGIVTRHKGNILTVAALALAACAGAVFAGQTDLAAAITALFHSPEGLLAGASLA
jgi:hypothetical protein